MENCVAETAFIVLVDKDFEIRWFTPEIEMDLCGHATLAAAHVLTKHLGHLSSPIGFWSNSEELLVAIEKDLLTLNFPSRIPEFTEAPQIILDGINQKPVEVLKSRDYVLVFESEEIIRQIEPNQIILNQINIDPGGIIVTAPGREVDFVSRFFTPQASIFEDPVTGSAHCSLIPYWAKKLGKDKMLALQLSPRGGKLFCKDMGDRVLSHNVPGGIYFNLKDNHAKTLCRLHLSKTRFQRRIQVSVKRIHSTISLHLCGHRHRAPCQLNYRFTGGLYICPGTRAHAC